MTRPICAPIRSMRSGSKLAPQHSGDGYTVACQAASPVRHSSCTMAGIPCRPAATICRWTAATARAPSAGLIGAVPYGRVSCPTPSLISASQLTSGAAASCWCGATGPLVASTPTQTPYSCAIFSRTVIWASRSRTRSAGLASGSRQVSAERLRSMVTWGSVRTSGDGSARLR